MPSLRNVNVTTRVCAVCDGPLPAGRARRWCSDACRQAAYRARHARPVIAPPPIPASAPRRPHTVYECPDCGNRALGTQRCEDCNIFMTRVGIGGISPCCGEPVAYEELVHRRVSNARVAVHAISCYQRVGGVSPFERTGRRVIVDDELDEFGYQIIATTEIPIPDDLTLQNRKEQLNLVHP